MKKKVKIGKEVIDPRISDKGNLYVDVDNIALDTDKHVQTDVLTIPALPEMPTPHPSGRIIGLVGTGGRGEVYLINDTNTYQITSTSWVNFKYHQYRMLAGFPNVLGIGIRAYIDTSGQTLYIRIRNRAGETLWSVSWTETTATYKYASVTSRRFGFPDFDALYFDGYVTGGTGYVTNIYVITNPSLVPILGWKYVVGEGFHLRPIKVDDKGQVYKAFKTTKSLNISETSVPAGGSVTIFDITTGGELKQLMLWATYIWMRFYIELDEVRLKYGITDYLTPGNVSYYLRGYNAVTVPTGIELVQYDTTNNIYTMFVTLPLQWKTHCKVWAYNSDTTARTIRSHIIYVEE